MFRLAHLSDPHIGPLPAPTWRELMNKRLTGYLNWRRGRAHHHRMDVLDRLIADIVQADVDHVAVTGDLVNLGLPDEYKAARTLLWRIGPPERVSFVPGNHDAYMRQTVPQIVLQWRPWFLSDGVAEDEGGYAFPFTRVRGQVALVGVNSGVPTAPFLATGFLGSRQIAALADELQMLGEQGLARLVLIHHPPFDIGPQKRLGDHRELAAMLAKVGCEAVLHGHTHKGTLKQLKGPSGLIPVIGVPSASATHGGRHEGAAWNLVTVTGEPGAWQVAVERRPVA
ncbi:metallophosphoesterase family protein [Phreatobacter oligotrophus]|jgi:3',5'-cyclic AMP phosphodiesterase CpdA|uniref:metallophosphoesterase family protein n=1 Tax=Phreatobacter oligotrophus TaxID=1122261 RepID=UPI00235643F8|nr:metallophosphoesterase [Phreatobacter oligotrophus]MBX9990617.1 metallophosphoesterase [Phreatobacter oligotrophus]